MPASRAWMTCSVMGSTIEQFRVSGFESCVGNFRKYSDRFRFYNSRPETRNSKPLVASARAQFARFGFVNDKISILRSIDGYAVNLPRPIQRHVAVAHVVEHPLRVALQRIAETAATGCLQTKDITGMQHVVRETRGND